MNGSVIAKDPGSTFRFNPLIDIEKRLLCREMAHLGNPPVTMVMGNGSTIYSSKGKSVGTIIFRDQKTLMRFLVHPELHFGDAYTEGNIDVEGDLVEVLASIFKSMLTASRGGLVDAYRAKIISRPRLNTLSGSRDNIHDHYDIGNDFYRLWLDERMQYTCAYFPSALCYAGKGPDRQDGPCVQKADAQAR